MPGQDSTSPTKIFILASLPPINDNGTYINECAIYDEMGND